MGLKSILPKPRTTIPNKENPIYPFLLKGVVFTYANQAWGVDITYLRLSCVTTIRVRQELENSMRKEELEGCFSRHGGRPAEIDQHG